jgi:hypothetical protein
VPEPELREDPRALWDREGLVLVLEESRQRAAMGLEGHLVAVAQAGNLTL